MRQWPIILSAALIITVCAASSGAAAETAPGQDQSQAQGHGQGQVRSEPVVVSATRTEKVLRDVPASVEIVTDKQIRERPVQTISDALRDLPGVQVLDNTMAGVQRISIRGETGTRVLVLVDGMKISDQKSMDGSTIMMDPNFIERIEVVKGPASVLYGSEAIGGAINIITKKGGTRPVQATLMTSFDSSVDGWNPKGSVFGKLGNVGYRVTGTYIDAGDRNAPDDKIDRTAYINRYVSAYLDYQWDKATIAGGYEFYKNSSNPLPGAYQDPVTISMGLPRWQRERYYLNGEVREISEYLSKIKANVYRQQILKNFWNNINVPIPMGRPNTGVVTDINTDGNITTYGGSMQTEWSLGKNNYLVAGVDIAKDWLKSNDRYDRATTVPFGAPPNTRTTHAIADDHLEGDQLTMAAFVQDEWTFYPGWTATVGVRETWVHSALRESKYADTGAASDSHPVFSAGLVYSGFKDWRFRANFGQGYRYPNLQQLYTGTSHGATKPTYGNPDLDPETSNNFEVGVRYNTDAWLMDLAVYHSRAKNYIESAEYAAYYQYENVDKARTSGVEARLEYTFTSLGLTPYVTGTYMYRELQRDNGETSQTGDPRLMGTVGLRFERELLPKFVFTADLYGRMASSAKYLASDNTYYEYPGWSTLNLNLGVKYGDEQQYFANIAFNNITNREYRTARGSIDEPGFNVVAQVGVEF